MNSVALKTPHGLSQRKTAGIIICPEEPLGPIESSLHIYGIGKKGRYKALDPYKYKDKVEIHALGFVYDIISVSEKE